MLVLSADVNVDEFQDGILCTCSLQIFTTDSRLARQDGERRRRRERHPRAMCSRCFEDLSILRFSIPARLMPDASCNDL